MEREFILGISLLVNEDGTGVKNAPVVPLLIRAADPTRALRVFADRSEAEILNLRPGRDDKTVLASIHVDEKVFGVSISSSTL